MNTQQKIDCLNTIINERESAIWLKEVLQDALKYLDELSTRDSRIKALDDQIVSKQAIFEGLTKKYQAKGWKNYSGSALRSSRLTSSIR